MAVTSARGMRDFLPRDKERRDGVLAVIAETYLRHGFEPIETPALEDLERLHSGLGGDNEKLSFQVHKRGLTAEDIAQASTPEELSDLGLRFDLTVPLARFYASNHGALPPVFRSFQVGPVWRAERPQKGRYRQFVQCDIDIVGQSEILAEVETMLAAADVLDRLGVAGWSMRVNDRRLLLELLASAGINKDHHNTALITLDKLDKIGAEGVLQELKERLPEGFSTEVLTPVLSGVTPGFDPEAIAAVMGGSLAALDAATQLCSWVGVVEDIRGQGEFVWDPTLVRGMGYYTGSIMEATHPNLGVSLGGGGRYDGMIGRFLGTEVPAVGFSLGFERLVEILPTDSVASPTRVALVYEAGSDVSHVMKLKMQLVSTGHTVRLVAGTKNRRALYERLVVDGFSRAAEVDDSHLDAEHLPWRELDA